MPRQPPHSIAPSGGCTQPARPGASRRIVETDGGAERKPDEKGDDTDTEDLSDTTAPSIGPNTTFEKDDPEERLARHEQSDVDAMGLDKRREVIGGTTAPASGAR